MVCITQQPGICLRLFRWSPWCYPGWITERPYWLVFWLTWYVVYSRYWKRQHGWSIVWDPRTISPTLLPAFTGCASRSGSITRSLCWHTKFYTEVHRGIWDHSFLLLISPADGHYALVAPIVWWCHLSDVQQSVTGRSRLLDPCLEHSAGGDNDVADAVYLPSTT